MYESLDFHLTVATLSLPIKAKPTFVCVDYVINVDHRRTLLRKQDSPSEGSPPSSTTERTHGLPDASRYTTDVKMLNNEL